MATKTRPDQRAPREATIPVTSYLSGLRVRGKKATANLSKAVTTADCSLSIDLITEITITVYDPKFKLLASGLFDLGGEVDFQRFKTEIASLETGEAADGQGQVTLKCWSLGVQKLKRRRGPRVLRKASPTEFIEEECRRVGLDVVAQPSAKRKMVARDTKKNSDSGKEGTEQPSSWTTFQRFARELGYVVFESGGTLYFGKPTWLRKRDASPVAVVTYATGADTDSIGIPVITETKENEEGVGISLAVTRERVDEVMPGNRIRVAFPGYGKRTYLIKSLEFPIAGLGEAQLTAGIPIDPEAEGRGEKNRRSATSGADRNPDVDQENVDADDSGDPDDGGGDGGGGGGGGDGEGGKKNKRPAAAQDSSTGPDDRRAAPDFAHLVLQRSDGYLYGTTAQTTEDASHFDGSELVMWAANKCGAFVPTGRDNLLDYCAGKNDGISIQAALRQRGAILFTDSYVAMSLGDGRTVEPIKRQYGIRTAPAADPGWIFAARVPGLLYPKKGD